MTNLVGLNVVHVRSMDDFPDPVTGVITLPDGLYILETALVTSDRFFIPDTTAVRIEGTSAFVGGIVYTGTGIAFTGNDIVALDFNETFITCPLGTLWSITNATPKEPQMFLTNTAVFDVVSFGTLQNIQRLVGYFNAFSDIGDGLLLDTVDILSFNQSSYQTGKNNVTTFFTVQGTMLTFNMNNVVFETNTNEAVFDFKSTLTIGGATIVACPYNDTLGGSLFAAGSKDETDINLNFQANSNMPRSIVFGNMTLPTTETVTITTLGVPVIVNDATTGGSNIWTELGNTSRFAFDSTLGRYTYTGLEDVNVEIISSSSIEKSGGGSDFIATFIAKNGTVLSESKSGSQSTNPTNVVSLADILLVTGDYIELAVQNDGSTANIIIDVSNFIIKD